MLLSRRSFLSMAGAVAFGAAAVALPGCGEGRGSGAASAASAASSASATADAAASSASAAAASTSALAAAASSSASASLASPKSDALVIYFSRAGENYGVGVVEEGNTSVVAHMIAEKTGADLFEIVPAQAYPEGYDECCDVALAEQNEGARPAFQGDVDIASYKTVYLGYPIWWGDLPMCVYTFLEAHDWSGKDIRPFCTHEGSGIGSTPASIESTCAAATVGQGLSMTGSTAQNSRDQARASVEAWLG